MARKIRVAMLLKSYHRTSYGGAEKQVASLAPFLIQHGVELHVITHGRPVNDPDKVLDGVYIHRTPYHRIGGLKTALYTAFGTRLIAKIQPDVLHAHGLFSPTITGMLGRRSLGLPLFSKVLRGGVHGDVIRVKDKPLGELRIKLMRDHVTGFVTISEEIRKELINAGIPPEQCHSIPNGVDTERYQPLSADKKRAKRIEMGLGDDPILIYVGRLVPEKRVDLLLKSWRTVTKQFPNAQLFIIGVGSESDKLKAMAGERVQFLGRIDNVEDWLQIADLYVLPSASEGLSNSMLEAMSSALPMIVTAVGAAPDLMQSEANGWCIEPNNEAALTDALTDALSDLDATLSKGQNNRDRILKDFQLSVTADKLYHMYQQAIL